MFWNKKQPSQEPQTAAGLPRLVWGTVELDPRQATGHFLAIGAPGSGKTIMLRLLLQSVLPHIKPGDDARVLTFDAKQEMLPVLSGMHPRIPIWTTNPFDERGVAWDLARDVREPQVAVELAFTLFPEVRESQPFFTDAARHLLYGVVLRYLSDGASWDLLELVQVLRNMRELKALLRGSPLTSDLADQYLRDRRLAANISSTIASKLLPFEAIAAAWRTAKHNISLEDWAQESQILILGNSETSRTAIQTINRCMFKRAVDICLHQSESFTRRTWMVADELSECGYLPGMVSALKRGRSKGICIAMGFQSVSGLRDPKLYGPYFSDEILGLVANRFVGRLECPATAEFISKLFGDYEVESVSTTRSYPRRDNSFTENRQLAVKRTVLPGELMNLPECNQEHGMHGFYIVRSYGAFTDRLDGEQLFQQDLWPVDPAVPELIPRPVEAQYLIVGKRLRRVKRQPDLGKQKRLRPKDSSRVEEFNWDED